jgi:hypothetical protein
MEIAAVSYETRSHIVSLACSIHLPGRTDAARAPLIETKADMHTRSLLAFVYRVDETHHDRRDGLPGQIPAAHRYDQPLLSSGAPIAGRTRRGLGNAGASLCRIVHLRRCPTSVTGDASSAVAAHTAPEFRARRMFGRQRSGPQPRQAIHVAPAATTTRLFSHLRRQLLQCRPDQSWQK